MKNPKLLKLISIFLCCLLIYQQTGFAQVASVELNLASHFASLQNTLTPDRFRPLHLRSISYDSLKNNFKLLLDKGDSKLNTTINQQNPQNPRTGELENSTKELFSYFLVGLALPNDSFWVNLRPDSPDNIIDPLLAQTEVGRILLEADLQLKKDTSGATSPNTAEGKEYWDKLYSKAEELYGTQNVTIPTLTRPWIVPDEIIIRESIDQAYVYKATLKVMLEQDYLKSNTTYSFKDDREKQLNEYSSQLIRELIIPKLTREINSSKRYAPLRQVYYSLILAQWFKARANSVQFTANSLQSNPYTKLINSKNLTNLQSKAPYSSTTYFTAYKENFSKGEYNIKEPKSTPYGQVVRSYFSGGAIFDLGAIAPLGAVNTPGSPVSMVPVVNPILDLGQDLGLTITPTDNPGEYWITRGESTNTVLITVQGQDKEEQKADLQKKLKAINDAHNKQTLPEKVESLKSGGLTLQERRGIIEKYVAGSRQGPEARYYQIAKTARVGSNGQLTLRIFETFNINLTDKEQEVVRRSINDDPDKHIVLLNEETILKAINGDVRVILTEEMGLIPKNFIGREVTIGSSCPYLLEGTKTSDGLSNLPDVERIRISAASFCIIKVGNLYLLSFSRNRFKKGILEIGPIGGAYSFIGEAGKRMYEQAGIDMEPDNREEPLDMRQYIPRNQVDAFVELFNAGIGRETYPTRELEEELIHEERILERLPESVRTTQREERRQLATQALKGIVHESQLTDLVNDLLNAIVEAHMIGADGQGDYTSDEITQKGNILRRRLRELGITGDLAIKIVDTLIKERVAGVDRRVFAWQDKQTKKILGEKGIDIDQLNPSLKEIVLQYGRQVGFALSAQQDTQARRFLIDEGVDIEALNEKFGNIIQIYGYGPFQRLYESAGPMADNLFKSGLLVIRGLFTSEEFERYWPVLVLVGIAAGKNVNYLFGRGFPVVKRNFTSEEFDFYLPSMVRAGIAAGENAADLFMDGFLELKQAKEDRRQLATEALRGIVPNTELDGLVDDLLDAIVKAHMIGADGQGKYTPDEITQKGNILRRRLRELGITGDLAIKIVDTLIKKRVAGNKLDPAYEEAARGFLEGKGVNVDRLYNNGFKGVIDAYGYIPLSELCAALIAGLDDGRDAFEGVDIVEFNVHVLFEDAFSRLAKTLTPKELLDHWPDLMRMGLAAGENAGVLFGKKIPAIKKVFVRKGLDFDHNWPALASLGVAADKDAPAFFDTLMFIIEYHVFTPEELDGLFNLAISDPNLDLSPLVERLNYLNYCYNIEEQSVGRFPVETELTERFGERQNGSGFSRIRQAMLQEIRDFIGQDGSFTGPKAQAPLADLEHLGKPADQVAEAINNKDKGILNERIGVSAGRLTLEDGFVGIGNATIGIRVDNSIAGHAEVRSGEVLVNLDSLNSDLAQSGLTDAERTEALRRFLAHELTEALALQQKYSESDAHNAGQLAEPMVSSSSRVRKALAPILGDRDQKQAQKPIVQDNTTGTATQASSSNTTAAQASQDNKKGGIDFRTLPIVIQSMDNLKAGLRSIPQNTLQNINLTKEWSDIERLVNSGTTPSSERLKEYLAASCFKGNLNTDTEKILSCIGSILRMEEESCDLTEPMLKDMLVVLGSGSNGEELKLALAR